MQSASTASAFTTVISTRYGEALRTSITGATGTSTDHALSAHTLLPSFMSFAALVCGEWKLTRK